MILFLCKHGHFCTACLTVNLLALKVKLCGKLPWRILLVLFYFKSLLNSRDVIYFNIKAVQKKYMLCGDLDLDWTTICLKFFTRALLILLLHYAFHSHLAIGKVFVVYPSASRCARIIINCCYGMQAKTLLTVWGVFCE